MKETRKSINAARTSPLWCCQILSPSVHWALAGLMAMWSKDVSKCCKRKRHKKKWRKFLSPPAWSTQMCKDLYTSKELFCICSYLVISPLSPNSPHKYPTLPAQLASVWNKRCMWIWKDKKLHNQKLIWELTISPKPHGADREFSSGFTGNTEIGGR